MRYRIHRIALVPLVAVGLAAAVAVPALAAQPAKPTTSAANRARLIKAMDELVAEDYLDHHPPPFPGLPSGREGLKAAFRIFWEATPGRHEIQDQVAEGDKVVTRLIAYGRHEDDLPGPLPATGAEMRQTAVVIHRIAERRIAEHWSDRDDLSLMQQLGVVSLPGG